MCDRVVLLDGTELTSLGDLVDNGAVYDAGYTDDELRQCLCVWGHLLFPASNELGPPRFRRTVGGYWDIEEVDAHGLSFPKDGLIVDKKRSKGRLVALKPNPDYPYRKPQP